MSILRGSVYSLVSLASIVAVFFVRSDRSLAKQNPDPQTQQQIQVRDALNQGVQAFKNGQYEEAIQQFSHAKQWDPKLIDARLYLATTYASQYIPGAPSERNRQEGEAAIAEFRELLNLQPDNIAAIDGIGSLLFQMAGQPFDRDQFAESKSFHQKHIALRPQDPEPYYWVGVIDWTLSFRADRELRAEFNQHARGDEQLGEADSLPAGLREQYRQEYGTVIAEGMESLKHAIELRADYDDAMAYLSLLCRRKADAVAYESERAELTAVADEWLDKIKEIKQKRMEPQPP
jgi:tetratricopeptide (TPR) repeat protein